MNETRNDAQTKAEIELLREVIASYTDHPGDIRISTKPVPGALFFVIDVHADDQGKVIGKGGIHLRALKFLVAEIGRDSGTAYRITLNEPEARSRKIETPTRENENYNALAACGLLARLVAFIAGGQTRVESERLIQGGHLFKITFQSEVDRARFTSVYPGTGIPGVTLLGVIETLWRAFANKEGTHFTLLALPPP